MIRFVLLMLAVVPLNAQIPEFQIFWPHRAEILGFLGHGPSSSLLTWSADGSLLIRDQISGQPKASLNLRNIGRSRLRLHPTLPRLLFSEVEDSGQTRLAVYDWQSHRLLWEQRFSEDPLFFDFSGQGSFALVSQIRQPQFSAYDAQTGLRQNLLERMTTIPLFFYMGSSERTLMTLNSQGSLQYWDVSTQQPQLGVNWGSGFEKIWITSDKRYLVALQNQVLGTYDRLTGQLVWSTGLFGGVHHSFNELTDELTVLGQQDGRPWLRAWTLQNGRGLERTDLGLSSINLEGQKAAFLWGPTLYLGDHNGNLFQSFSAQPGQRPLVERVFEPILAAAQHGPRLYTLQAQEIRVFESTWLSGAGVRRLTQLRSRSLPHNLTVEAPIVSADVRGFWLWSRGPRLTRLYHLPIGQNEVRHLQDWSQSFVSLRDEGDSFLAVTGAGQVLRIPKDRPEQFLTLPGTDLRGALTQADGNYLLAWNGPTPLIEYKPTRGETVIHPLPSGTALFDVVGRGSRVFLFGRQAGSNPWNFWSWESTGSLTTLWTSTESQAPTAYISSGPRLWIATGAEGLTVTGAEGTEFRPSPRHRPESLQLSQNWILSLDRQGRLNFWDPESRRNTAQLSTWVRNGWILTLPAQRGFFADPLWENEVQVLVEGLPAEEPSGTWNLSRLPAPSW